MEQNVFFSIIIPIYNAEFFLHQCIDSVLRQDYQSFELILVDDGSIDGSAEVCSYYCKIDTRVKYYKKKNEGQIATRLFGIDKAVGEFSLFLDADDLFEENSLIRIFRHIKSFECDCLIFGISRFKGNKTIDYWSEENDEPFIIKNKKDLYKKVLLNSKYNSLCRKAVRTSILKNRKFDEYFSLRHGEDLIQSLTVYKESNFIAFVPEIFYKYRINENSISFSQDINNYCYPFLVQKAVYSFITKEEVFDKEDIELYRKFCLDKLLEEIIKISSFSCTNKQKKEQFLKILDNDFYTKFLKKPSGCKLLSKKRRILLFLFDHRCFWLLKFSLRFRNTQD